jgi:hypothetical protein
MNFKIATGLIAVLLFARAVPLAKSDDKDKNSDKARTLTGYLQKVTRPTSTRLPQATEARGNSAATLWTWLLMSGTPLPLPERFHMQKPTK